MASVIKANISPIINFAALARMAMLIVIVRVAQNRQGSVFRHANQEAAFPMGSGFGVASLGGALVLAGLTYLPLLMRRPARLPRDRLDRPLVDLGGLVGSQVVLGDPGCIVAAGLGLVGVTTSVYLGLGKERQSEQHSEK